jgi:predicted Zn-dependent protease
MGIFDANQGQSQGPSPGPGQRRGFGGRLILAIGIALIAWIMYMNQTEENPVTKEKQHVALTPDQEIRLGLESAPEMAKEMGGEVPADDPRAKEVQNIGNYLVSHTLAQKSPWKFQFHLLADPKTVNAFALPGGQIFITLGLLDKLQTEAQLAGVLGHEMGHVIERHSAEQMATNQLGNALAVAVGTAASDQSTAPYMVAAVVNQMVQLRYSREDESEADIWGLKLMSQAGYDPRAMVEVMKILKAAGGRGQSIALFQSHPDPDLRIKQIEEYLAKNPPSSSLSEGRNLKGP